MLQKSAAADGCPSAFGLGRPALICRPLTLVTQLQRYAAHRVSFGLQNLTPYRRPNLNAD
jgi:hypothetical protein